MRAQLTEALDPVLRAVRATSEENDAKAAFPTAALTQLRSSGLLGLLVRQRHGGMDAHVDDLVDVTVALARADMSTALVFSMHCQQVAALQRYGAPDLLDEILPEVARGQVYIASITTAPGSGGHLLSLDGAAVTNGATVHIDRNAPIVTGGQHADAFLITMRTPGSTSGAIDLILARRSQVRAEVVGDWQPVGMRATESVPMHVVGDVPARYVVGGHAAFQEMVPACFAPFAHIGWAAAWLGAAAGALSRVLEHLRHSKPAQFDPTSEHWLIQVARIRGRLDGVNAVLRHATGALQDDAVDPAAPQVQLLVNRLKTFASRECFTAVDELIELIGLRHGYLTDSPLALERTWRDLRSASLNYSNHRLEKSNGALTLMDTAVRFA